MNLDRAGLHIHSNFSQLQCVYRFVSQKCVVLTIRVRERDKETQQTDFCRSMDTNMSLIKSDTRRE